MTKMDKSDTHSSDDDLVWYSKGNCFAIKGVYVLTITVIDPGYSGLENFAKIVKLKIIQ